MRQIIFVVLFFLCDLCLTKTINKTPIEDKNKLTLLLDALRKKTPTSFLITDYETGYTTEDATIKFYMNKTTITGFEKFVVEVINDVEPYSLKVSFDNVVSIDGRIGFLYLGTSSKSWEILQTCNFNKIEALITTNIDVANDNVIQIPTKDFAISVNIKEMLYCSNQNYEFDLLQMIAYINSQQQLISELIKDDTIKILNNILKLKDRNDGNGDDDNKPDSGLSLVINCLLLLTCLTANYL